MARLPDTLRADGLELRRWRMGYVDDLVAVGLHAEDDPGFPEIGYWVRSDRTGRGYATLVAKAMVDAAFTFLDGASRVKIRMDRANLGSARIPTKVGFSLACEEDREIAAKGHTGVGLVWVLDPTG